MVTRDFTQGGSPKSCFWPILTRKMKFGVKKYFFSNQNPIVSSDLIYGHHTLTRNSKKHILTIFLCNFPLEWLEGLLHRDFRAKFWDKNLYIGRCGGVVQVKIFFGRGNGIFYQLLTYYVIWRHFLMTEWLSDWVTEWVMRH